MSTGSKAGKGNALTVIWDVEDWSGIVELVEQLQATSIGRVTPTDVIRLGVRELIKSRLPGRAA